MATRAILAELTAMYQLHQGVDVLVESVGGVDAARRVESREAFDVVVLASGAMEKLLDDGHLQRDTLTPVARSGIAVAVQAGAKHPDISSEDALREALLKAPSISHSTGPSGAHLLGLFEKWGIADTLKPRIVQAPPGVPVGTLVARGDVALGFQQLSELMHLPGIDVVGPLPADVQTTTVFAAAMASTCLNRIEAMQWVKFLNSAKASEVKRKHGMDPA